MPVLYCDDGSEIELPFLWCICISCQGHGKSSAYLGAYTQSEMDEAGPEFFDDYMAGRYDRPCETCDGTGKIKVVDRKKLTPAQRLEWDEQRQCEREERAIRAAERRMGA